MRAFMLVLLGILLAGSPLPAQARKARLELESGAVVEGRVVNIDSRRIVIDVDGEERTFATEQVRSYKFDEILDPVAPAAAGVRDGAPAAPKAAPARRAEPAPAATAQEPAPQVAANPAADAGRPKRYRSLWDRRLDALDRLYPWAFPSEPSQWVSLGVMLFALLSLAVHFAARLCATDYLYFGRALGIGLWLFLSTVGLMAMLPGNPAAIAGAVAGNVIVMLVLFAVAYGLSFGASFLATLLLAIEGGIGFALLQLVDATLRSIGNTTF